MSEAGQSRIAIIDIGSNSVRLVVYQGLRRVPSVLFNEKVMAGLGRGLQRGGELAPEAMDVALAALHRFALLCRTMEVDSLRAVATAAVRAAANSAAFVARVKRETGINVDVIDGEAEARGAAMGVIAGIPEADGVVGDLGGGSLELVRVAGGQVHERMSLPLGALRLDAAMKEDRRALTQLISGALQKVEWAALGRGKPFYVVGGSWRALTQLHIHLTHWPLPVVHQHVMPLRAADRLIRTLAQTSRKSLKALPSLSTSRVPQLPGAALLLRAVTQHLGSKAIISSAWGLREGLLFSTLPEDVRHQHPLLAAARDMALRSGRFSDGSEAAVGEALFALTAPLFAGEPPHLVRIREAACLLADTSWRAHPDMRAEHGMDTALHGSWVGIDATGRAMLAAALWVVNGGSLDPMAPPSPLGTLAPPSLLAQARLWGLALRLGQRLGGGAAAPLAWAQLERTPAATLRLSLAPGAAALYGESVARRHRTLAQAMALEPELQMVKPPPLR